MSITSDASEDEYMKPSWEVLIDELFIDVKTHISEYLETDHFKFEWKHWGAHRGGVCSRFRDMIQFHLGIDNYEKEHCKFPIKTETLSIIMRVIEHSLCAQFNLLFNILPDAMNDFTLIKALSKTIVDESFNRLEPDSSPSLLEDLYAEYKISWNATEKIQIVWRRAISNPAYALCLKRLQSEYKELQE
jgi:hypothetical protein